MKRFRDAGRTGALQASEPVTGEVAVASRAQALQTLKKHIGDDRRALALVTGESGSGKTWLWQRLTTEPIARVALALPGHVRSHGPCRFSESGRPGTGYSLGGSARGGTPVFGQGAGE